MNPLLAVSFAAASAVTFAGFSVLVRKSVGGTTAFTGNLISLGVGAAILGPASLVFSAWDRLTPAAALWFAAGGALAPGLAQVLLFLGIRYIGVGRAMPMVTLSPFFSTAVAMAWLGERPGADVLAATAAVVAGCALISMKPEGDAGWRRVWLLLPIGHALAFAFAASMRRYALALVPDPLIGATIANAVSIPVMFVIYPFLPGEERIAFDRRGLWSFGLCGLVLTVSFLTHFAAYRFGEVSIVVPIVYSAPLFSLLMARLWLREEERVTWQKIAGAALLFAGMAAIIWRAA